MRLAAFVFLAALLTSLTGCDSSDRIAALEKQTQQLQEDVKKISQSSEYDLQEKCEKEARDFFKREWESAGRDRTTLVLEFTNHYSRKENRCFMRIDFRYLVTPQLASWNENVLIWDVQENSQLARYGGHHEVSSSGDTPKTEDWTVMCEVNEQKCKTMSEFNNLTRSYLVE